VSAATTHHVTGRLVSAVLLVIALGNLAVTTGSAWFVLLAAAMAGLVVVGVASRARLDGLALEIGHAARVTAGDLLGATITVVNRDTRPSSATRLCLHTPGLADVTVSVGRLDPGDRSSVVVQRLATRRATAETTTAHVVCRPSLGLLVARREVEVADQLVVHPVLHDLPAGSVTTAVLEQERSDLVVAASGPEVLGVREWRSGDDRARVHWRSTARSGRLTVLERGDIESAELRLVLVGSDRHEGFEEAISVAASICDAALTAGTRVAAVAWHADGPVLGAAESRWELLDWWSSVRDTVLPDPARFGGLVVAGFGPGDLLVAGAPDADGTWLAAAAAQSPGLRLRRVATAP
jgi:uncharacterized protein (DUF58 family)